MRVPEMSPEETYQFWRNYSEWQRRVTDAFRGVSTDIEETALTERTALNMTDMLNSLPYQQRQDLLLDYRRLIKFDDVMAQAKSSGGLRNIGMGQYGMIKKFVIDKGQIDEGNPIALLLNRMNIQHDPLRPLKRGLGPEAEHYFGANILRTDAIKAARRSRANAEAVIKGGKKVFIFDTETAGLATDIAGVREVGGGMYRMQGGQLINEAMATAHFRTAKMEMGSIWRGDLNKVISLGEDEAMKAGSRMGIVTGSGDEFAEKLIPFLKNIIEADHIAGHNVEFDIRQTMMNLMRTGAYKNGATIQGEDIRALVDSAMRKIGSGRHLIDTRELLMQAMPGLDLAPELRNAGKLAPYSLENVMLRTDLARRMIADMGEDAAKAFFTGGAQHSAEYDTTITAYMMKYLSDEVNPLKSGRGMLGRTGLEGIIRANTIKAGANIPTAHIKDITHLDPALFREILEGKYQHPLEIFSTSTGQAVDLSSNTVEGWINRLSKPNQTDLVLRSNISYMEQQIWASRRASQVTPATGIGVGEIVGGLGQWRRASGIDTPYQGFLNKDSTLFKMGTHPGDLAYADMVDSMAALGNQFADLSPVERQLTSALSQASAAQTGLMSRLGKGVQRTQGVADDLGILHFAQQESFYGVDRVGQNVSIPLDVMKAAEANIQVPMANYDPIIQSRFLATDGEVQMLNLSPFEGAEGRAVNLSYELKSQAEADRLADWIAGLAPDTEIYGRSLASYGIEDSGQLMRLAENIRTRGMESGIAVGYMKGDAGEHAYRAMENIFGSARDKGRPPLRVAYSDSGNGAVQTGPAILDRFMEASEVASLRGKIYKAAEQFGQVAEHLERPGNFAKFTAEQKKLRLGQVSKGIGEMFSEGNFVDIYNIVKGKASTPRGKLAIGGAALGLSAYYMFRRHKEREPYLEPFDQRPIENPNPPPRIVDQPELSPSRMNPMATSEVVSTLDRNKTGHTKMGSGKYSNLYGGAI